MLKVAIIMGSTSDYDVMSGAEQILSDFGIEFEKRVISAHRTPELMFEDSRDVDSEWSSPEPAERRTLQVWRQDSQRCRL